MEKTDHDLLIEINRDMKHVRNELTECNKRYLLLRRDVDCHDSLMNKMKGATAATIVFLTVFGGVLLYMILG